MFALPAIVCMLIVIWRPMYQGIVWSFYRLSGYTPVEFVGFKNYIDVMGDSQFLKTLGNTFMYVAYGIIFGFLPPVIIAIFLNEMIRGKTMFKIAIYMPCLIPAVAVALLWSFIYHPSSGGLLNILISFFGAKPQQWLQNASLTKPLIILSMTWNGLGTGVLMYLAALQGINHELYEAAIVDGAGFMRRIWNITFPQISGVMLLLLVRKIIGLFQIMVEPLTMTNGGPNQASMSLALKTYQYAFVYFKADQALATGVITFLILLVATLFYFWLEKKVDDN